MIWDWKEYGGEMGVVLDDVLVDGGLKPADIRVEEKKRPPSSAVTVLCQKQK